MPGRICLGAVRLGWSAVWVEQRVTSHGERSWWWSCEKIFEKPLVDPWLQPEIAALSPIPFGAVRGSSVHVTFV